MARWAEVSLYFRHHTLAFEGPSTRVDGGLGGRPRLRAPVRVARVTNRLRVLRAEHDWSQADLAARLHVSRQTVNAIENERYDPSLPLAFAIAHVFGLAIEAIFTPEPDPPASGR
jgi:putative transcriptional regulator